MTSTSSTNAPAHNSTTTKRKTSWVKKIAIALSIVLAGVVVLVIALPTIVTSGPVQNWLIGKVNQQIQGTITVQNISIGWFKSLSIQGAELQDDQGHTVSQLDQLNFQNASLKQLLLDQTYLNLNAQTQAATLHLVIDENNQNNLTKALSPKHAATSSTATKPQSPANNTSTTQPNSSSTSPQWPTNLSILFEANNTTLNLQHPTLDGTYQFNVPNLIVDAQNPNQIQLKLNGTITNTSTTASQPTKTTQLLFDTEITGLFNPQNILDPTGADILSEFSLDQAPVDLIQTLLPKDSPIHEALEDLLGQELSIHLTTAGHLSNLITTIKLDSHNTSSTTVENNGPVQAEFKLAFDGKSLYLPETSKLTWQLSPKAIAGLTEAQLDQATTCTVQINTLSIPLKNSQPDLSKLASNITIGLTPTQMQVEELGTIAIGQTNLSLITTSLENGLGLTFNTTPSLNNRPGIVNIRLSVKDLLNNENQFALNQAGGNIEFKIQDAPVGPVLDDLLSLDQLLTTALGPTLRSTLILNIENVAPNTSTQNTSETTAATYSDSRTGNLVFNAVGDNWSTGLKANLANNTFTATSGTLRYILTQKLIDQYAAYTHKQVDHETQTNEPSPANPTFIDRLTLAKDAPLRVDLNSLSIPIEDKTFITNQLKADLQAYIFGLFLLDANQTSHAFGRLEFTAQTDQFDQGIQITTTTPNATDDLFAINLNGTIKKSNHHQQQTNTDKSANANIPFSFDGEYEIKNVPMHLIDHLAGTQSLLPRIFADTLTTSFKGALPGEGTAHIHARGLELNASLATLDFKQLAFPQGVNLAFQPLQLGENALLGQLHPVFDFLRDTHVIGMAPVRLAIDDGTQLHLENISLESLELNGSLTIGQVEMTKEDDLVNLLLDYAAKAKSDSFNDGDLDQLLDTINTGLELAGKQPLNLNLSNPAEGNPENNQATSKAKFTAMPFSLKDGVFSTGESWLTVRGVNLGFKGKTDLKTGTQDYKLALPSQVIQKFNPEIFSELLEDDRIYEFALGGKAGNQPDVKTKDFGNLLKQGVEDLLNKQINQYLSDQTKGLTGDDELDNLVGGVLGGLFNQEQNKSNNSANDQQNQSSTNTDPSETLEKIQPNTTQNWHPPAP